MEGNEVIFIGIFGAIISPLISAFGLYLQYRKDQKIQEAKKITDEAEAEKIKAEADKIKAEAKALDNKTDIDTINFYIGMVEALRSEVNNLTEISRRNNGEIATLTARLMVADEEKAKLAKDNAELLLEVQQLREEVAVLKKQQNNK